MAPRPFVHLHNHTDHSLLDGLTSVDDLCREAAADGQPAVAITDHGTMSAAAKLAAAAKKHGLKPVMGCEVYLAVGNDSDEVGSRTSPGVFEVPRDDTDTEPDTIKDDDPRGSDRRGAASTVATKKKRYEHLTVLATNQTGWSNLMAMVNAAATTRLGRKPLMDFHLLAEHCGAGSGIVLLSGCLGGPVAGRIARGDIDGAASRLSMLSDIAGREGSDPSSSNLFVEIMDHGMELEDRVVRPELIRFARNMNLPLVATNDTHYPTAAHAHAHEGWLCGQTKAVLSDANRFRFNGDGFHIRTAAEMRALFDDHAPGACDSTLLIAERTEHSVLPDYKLRLPRFTTDGLWTPSQRATERGYEASTALLYDQVMEGARQRYCPDGAKLPREVGLRLRHEFDTIVGKGFGDYFLIVADAINFARSQGIRVGPGRGSAAGCAVSYCLGITDIDPIANHLLFERFLDAERDGMPDIDVDFEKHRRGEVFTYLVNRWGEDRVARIGTLGPVRSKGALRTAATVLESIGIGDELARLVPMVGAQPMAFDDIEAAGTDTAKAFLEAAGSSESHRAVYEMARSWEGAVRTDGIHACGVVIADEPLERLIPLRTTKSDGAEVTVTQWDGKDIESFGFLKFDVLGLETLDVISACGASLERSGVMSMRDFNTLIDNPPTDPAHPQAAAAYAMLAEGDTAGVFQLESSGMTELCKAIAPNSLHDLAALVALFRPGPLGEKMHDRYANRKAGVETVDYSIFTGGSPNAAAEQEVIESVLGMTFGTPVYQEQLMRLGEVVAGYDAAGKNRLRKAISKKIESEMAAAGEQFINGAVKEIVDDEGNVVKIAFHRSTADALWAAMKGAGQYAFNASHSYGYGWLAYQTAFLKANWRAHYSAGLLAVTSKASKRQAVLASLRRQGVDVLAPSVNSGGVETVVVDDSTIRLGMGEVKGVGAVEARHIVEARSKGGPFSSLPELLARTAVPDVNDPNRRTSLSTDTIVALIEAGALDDLGGRLGLVMAAKAAKPTKAGTQADIEVPDAEWGTIERAARERDALGVLISPHPVEELWGQIVDADIPEWFGAMRSDLHRTSQIEDHTDEVIEVVGTLASWSERTFAGGSNRMANFVLDGDAGEVPVVMWSNALTEAKRFGLPAVGDVVRCRGHVRSRQREVVDDDGEVKIEESIEFHAYKVATIPLTDRPRFTRPKVAEPGRLLRLVLSPNFDGETPESDPEPAAQGSRFDHAETEEPATQPEPAASPALAHVRLAPAVACYDDDADAVVVTISSPGDLLTREWRTTAGTYLIDEDDQAQIGLLVAGRYGPFENPGGGSPLIVTVGEPPPAPPKRPSAPRRPDLPAHPGEARERGAA